MYRLIEADHYVNKTILMVGGGDSAVEAALGLANQTGNRSRFPIAKSGLAGSRSESARRMEDYVRSGKIRVLFNSIPSSSSRVAWYSRSTACCRNSPTTMCGSSPGYASVRLSQENWGWVWNARSKN